MGIQCGAGILLCAGLPGALPITADLAAAVSLHRPGRNMESGPAVTVHDDGDDAAAMSNGIATIINAINPARSDSIACRVTAVHDGGIPQSATIHAPAR